MSHDTDRSLRYLYRSLYNRIYFYQSDTIPRDKHYTMKFDIDCILTLERTRQDRETAAGCEGLDFRDLRNKL
ncbi:Uncharacterized protein HZ326_1674 [Fusarium oxysporum f. sp. albedinis]|nr:Uncharacterized protein HZ326_1674 [Fusarium oxysporum f. sp. albedinis]